VHWGRYSEHQKRSFGGNVWAPLGILGKASRIQCRYFGSVAETIQREPSFSMLNSDDISYFKGILGEKNVIQDEDRLSFANTDWMRKYKGSSKLLLLPRSTEEVLLSCLGVPDHHLGCV
jgi:D-2-hydroxyglutarate dehydrogenase